MKDRGLLKGSQRNRVGAVTRGSITSEGLLFPLKPFYADNGQRRLYYDEFVYIRQTVYSS